VGRRRNHLRVGRVCPSGPRDAPTGLPGLCAARAARPSAWRPDRASGRRRYVPGGHGLFRHRAARLVCLPGDERMGAVRRLAPAARRNRCCGARRVLEVTANLANLGWPLLLATFWGIAARGEERFDVVCRVVVVTLTALTITLAVLLVPWAIAFTMRRKRRADKVVLASLGGALTVQLIAGWFAPTVDYPGSSLSDLATEFGVRVLASFVVGERFLPRLWIELGPWLVLGGVCVLALVVALARRSELTRNGVGSPWAQQDWGSPCSSCPCGCEAPRRCGSHPTNSTQRALGTSCCQSRSCSAPWPYSSMAAAVAG
jgi:hypothetical protein